MTILQRAFSDLLAVPGLRGLILLDDGQAPRIYRLDHELSTDQIDSLVRGIGQVVRRLGARVSRMELRCERGRLVVRPLQAGLALALITDEKPNVPLLTLAIEEVVRVASDHREQVLETFRAGELLRYRAGIASSPLSSHGSPLSVQETLQRGTHEEPATASLVSVTSGIHSSAHLHSGVSSFTLGSLPPSPLSAAEAETPLADAPELAVGRATEGQVAASLTRISAAAAQFLGRSVIANYWRQTRAAADPLPFDVGVDGAILAHELERPTAAHVHEAARRWAQAFMRRCALIVVDLPRQLDPALDDEARWLLENRDALPIAAEGVA